MKHYKLFIIALFFSASAFQAKAQNNNGQLDQIEEFSSIITDSVVMPDGIKLMTDVFVPVLQDRLDIILKRTDLASLANDPTFSSLLPTLLDTARFDSAKITFLPKGIQLFIYDSLNGQPNPNPYQLPFVVTRTPYNKEGDFVGRVVSIMGYAYALQDMRGRYSSEGVYMPMYSDSWNKNADHPDYKHVLDVLPLNDPRGGNRHEDGYNSYDYIANKLKRYYDYNRDGIVDTFLFCNGSVGGFGASALGNTQLQGAAAHRINPTGRGLKSLLPIVAAVEHYNYTGYQNGVFRERIVTGWLRGQIFTGTDDELNDIDFDINNNIHSSRDYDPTLSNIKNKFDAANKSIDHFVEIRYDDPNGGPLVAGYYPNSRGRKDMDASRSPVDENGEAVSKGKTVNGVVVDVPFNDPDGVLGFGNSPVPASSRTYSRYTNLQVPAYQLTGWWDIFTDGQIQTWSLMKKYNNPANNPFVPAGHKAHKLQKLILGPWAHQTIGSRTTGDMRIPSPGELAPNGQPLPDRRYKTNVSDILGFDLGNLDQNNLNVADVLKSEVISWFRYNLNYNAYANIGMPTVFIPKSQKRKVEYLTNGQGAIIDSIISMEDYKQFFGFTPSGDSLLVQIPSADYRMTFEELINVLVGQGNVKSLPIKFFNVPLLNELEVNVDIPISSGEPLLPEFSGSELTSAVDSINYETVPDVRFYVVGPQNDGIAENINVGNYWFGSDTFPINNQVRFTDFYLHQNGSIDYSAPSTDEGYKVYVHDPNDAVKTIGGANMIVRSPQGDRDSQGQFNLMDPRYAPFGYNRTGIINYGTEVIQDSLCMIGFPRITLYAKTNPDGLTDVPTATDFFVRFLDEYPDGSVYFVTDACVNTSARDYARALVTADINNQDSIEIMDNIPYTNINAGDVYEYYFAGMPIAYTWAKGHKMRVIICSSNHTRYQVNPNLPKMDGEFFRRQPSDGQTYVFEGTEMEPRIAVQRVAHSPEHPTKLTLPIYQKNVTSVNNLALNKDGLDAVIFPNPTDNFVTIFANRNSELNVRIFNSIGQLSYENTFNDMIQIDVNNLEKGMYFVEVVNKKGNEKVVKKLTVF